MATPLKHPTALIPIAMSLGALATLVIHIALFGVTHEADEGTAAHIWQLLMAGQLPVIAIFVLMWLPRAPKQTLQVVAVQVVAALAALAPVYWLGL
jgi:mannose/fructose/N-acetylgalactosamine-specific phosphotransferase system component IID